MYFVSIYSAGIAPLNMRRCVVCGKPSVLWVEGTDVDGKTTCVVFRHQWCTNKKPLAFWKNGVVEKIERVSDK